MTPAEQRLAQTAIEELPLGLPGQIVVDASDESPLEHVQTHISHLLFTKDRVYKIRKAVRFPFLSFATRAERNEDCLLEVRLNRRLAPDVYLGVAPMLAQNEHFVVGNIAEELQQGGGDAAVPEHCVVMKRLRALGDAQSLLETGGLTPAHIDAIADRIAEFHAAHSLGRPTPYSPEAWTSRVESVFSETLQTIIINAPNAELIDLASLLTRRAHELLEARREALEARRRSGRAVDGHGDLQLAHIWFDGPGLEPSIIDCTEFNRDFRRIDSASEVAFLAMDLCYRGARKSAERFLARYAGQTDDFGLYALVDYYAAYRAAVRSKVAVLAVIDPELSRSQREAALASAHAHLRLAEQYLQTRSRGSITITCGSIGCGKSTVARAIADAQLAVVIDSDRTRKRLAGIRDTDHSAASGSSNTGLYCEKNKRLVYDAMLERAELIVDSGRDVVLDASFSSAAQRHSVLAWANARAIPARLVHVACAPDVALARLRKREERGTDPSDAGPSLYQWSVDHFELPTEWPPDDSIAIATDAPDWREMLAAKFEDKSDPALTTSKYRQTR